MSDLEYLGLGGQEKLRDSDPDVIPERLAEIRERGEKVLMSTEYVRCGLGAPCAVAEELRADVIRLRAMVASQQVVVEAAGSALDRLHYHPIAPPWCDTCLWLKPLRAELVASPQPAEGGADGD
jgi:hypothetical protein